MLRTRRRAAFSIIELLISLIIIAILVAMVILIASQRAAEARLRAAQSDLRQIAEAEQQASIDIGYFLRLYVLDDVTGPGDGSPQLPRVTTDVNDALIDEFGNTRNPQGEIFGILPDFGSLPTVNPPAANDAGDLRDIRALVVNETLIGIGLPYITYPKIYYDPAQGTDFSYGVPRDPWGQPYVIMTRQGFINDVPLLFGNPGTALLTGTVTMTSLPGALDATVFDRFTLLSFGPNALPGDGAGSDFGTDDDLILQLN